MQLKFKKVGLLSTVFVYCLSFLFQSNFVFFQTLAKEKNIPRVNIVTILVDNDIYGSISGGLQDYASYVQSKLTDTTALIIPLDLKNIHAYDIHRMMENIYFDGLSGVNSSLIGLIMFGNIPLPVVNQNGYIFPTVYPYVDFENQKYIWNPDSEYFVPNGNSMGQAEIWHGLIDYGDDVEAYEKFFEKIAQYDSDSDGFIGDSLWYDDFIAQKKGFINENYPYYRNRIMFAEDLGYQRHSPLMKKIFRGEQAENALDIVSDLEEVSGLDFSGKDILLEMSDQGVSDMHTTKIVQQEIESSFVSDYGDLFSNIGMSTMRENVFAGGRWIKEYEDAAGKKTLVADSDSSTSKIQLKDDILLGNENLQGLIENLNELMENMVDKKIENNKYDMDIVIPVSYEKITGKRLRMGFRRSCVHFTERYDNFYFGNSARYIDSAKDLSIYRGTYRNLSDIDGVTYASLLTGNNPSKTKYDTTNLKLRSIGSSYDVFSNQAEGNRGYMMTAVERDLDVYEEEKTAKDRKTKHRGIFGRVRDRSWPDYCDDSDKHKICENLFDFAQRWWGGASPINLDTESVSKGVYSLSGYQATNSWRSIFDMGGFQSLLSGDDEGMYGTGWIDGRGVGPQNAGTSFKAYIKYSSPTQRQGWERHGWYYDRYSNHTPDVHINFMKVNYRNLDSEVIRNWNFKKESENIFSIVQRSSVPGCRWFGSKVLNTKYTYKVISSIVKHVSTTEEEINGIDKNRYGGGGVLMGYYSDLKNAYQDLKQDVTDVVTVLTGLQSDVRSNNEAINSIITSLNSESDTLSGVVNGLNSLSSAIADLEEQINELENELQNAEGEERQRIQNQINDLNSQIDSLEFQIGSGEESQASSEARISSMLSILSGKIEDEKDQITDVYGFVTALSVDEIFVAMEYIAFMEDLNPEDFYSGVKNLSKVGFSTGWISDLKLLENDIKSKSMNIISLYQSVYELVNKQKSSRNTLKNKLLTISESNIDKIESLSYVIDGIFTISEDDLVDDEDSVEDDSYDETEGDEGDEGSETQNDSGVVTLLESTAYDVIKGASGLFDRFDGTYGVNAMFDWLIEKDKKGPAIEKAAKSDVEFKLWMIQNKIDFKEFNQADWINQYAQWVKGPGYDSEGAKKNHDLLLGVSEHMSGMNILTPDRPIDSPRYVSMQSIAGNEMKFIYPDLFKVEVYTGNGKNNSGYDKHLLLTGGQIKKNLIRYLTGKVYEYNKILDKECASSLNMNRSYDRLKQLGFRGAIPDKLAHGCDTGFTYEDFVEALGGEKMLDAIGEMLYYQSLTNTKKLSTGNVAEDIELIKSSFSLNEKRAQILKDYLVEGNEKKKNLIFEIPSYNVFGYEVAFINSDGEDYIFAEDAYATTSSSDKDTTNRLLTSNDLNITNPWNTSEEQKQEKQCPTNNGKLPLFGNGGSPWFEGLRCRWNQIKQEPFKVKLTFDSALGELLTADSFKDFIKDSELGQTFNDWGESWGQYIDSWDSLLNNGTGYDADLKITQIQMDADTHNKKVLGGDGGVTNLLSNVANNLKIYNTNLLLTDSIPSSDLSIQSAVDFGSITVEFVGTGDGCIQIDTNSLCNGNSFVTKPFNPKLSPFKAVVSSADHKAGKVALIMKISVGGQSIEKVIKYTVSPSDLHHFDIMVDDDKTVAGMITPISMVGYDMYNNKVSWGLEKYYFTVSQGKFLKDGAYQSGFSTNDFRDLRFYYQAPIDAENGSIAVIQVKSPSGKIIGTYNQTVVQAKPEITMAVNGNGGVVEKLVLRGDDTVANESYQLLPHACSPRKQWCSEPFYIGGKLLVERLKPIKIDMKDSNGNLVDVDSQVLVTSQNGLMIIGQVNKDDDGNDIFFETSKHYMKSGHLLLYFYPTTVAGNDVINIDIPGLDTRVVNLDINPLGATNLQLNIKGGYARLNENTDLEVFASDEWGNSSSRAGYIQVDPNYVVFPNLTPKYIYKDVVIYNIGLTDGYLKTDIYGTGAGLTSVKMGPLKMADERVVDHYEKRVSPKVEMDFGVVDNLLPESGLNIMYLNYFGNDRGNQWGYLSHNNKYVEKLMKKSKKIITTTTLLVSEDKIKKVLWKVDPGFKITNFENIDTQMTINKGNFDVLIGSLSDMKISSKLSFQWLTTTSDTISNVLNNKTNAEKNYIFFIPNDGKYTVNNGVLYDDGVIVGNINEGGITLQLTDQLLDNGDNIWNVINKGTNYGKLVVHYPGFMPKVGDFDNPGTRYFVSNLFGGSTDMMSSIGLFDGLSEFELDSSYKSIQDSDDVDEKVGFLGKFKNITLFAEGEIVGEATRNYGSEFVINLGDPVLSRKGSNEKVYGTNYDGGIGQEILTDSEKDIFGVYQIDFNNDGLKDWLLVYLDGAFKLAKNYNGRPNLRNMQELMRIAVNVKNVFVGDADGNGYEDILVLTDNNQIRAYLNNGGMFDVDGSVACLNQNVFEGEISSTPSSLEGLNKFYVEDMDLDGKVDIVTYDEKGYIKVFYGGRTSDKKPFYLSTETYACDTGWFLRQSSTIVTALGVSITSDSIYDNSMMSWIGIKKPPLEITHDELPDYGIKIFKERKEDIIERDLKELITPKSKGVDGNIGAVMETVMNAHNFDVTIASDKFIENDAKYVNVTLYENELKGSTGKNYLFVPISYLDPVNHPEDLCSATKSYYINPLKNPGGIHPILMDGDVVTVVVTVRGESSTSMCRGVFGDVIQGPWDIYYDKNGIITGFEFSKKGNGAIYKGRDGNFAYLVDNIVLAKGETMSFKYDLVYHHVPLKEMSLTYKTFWSDDDYPDIKLQSEDGCEKDFDGYISEGGKFFRKEVIPLQDFIDREYLGEDAMTEDYATDVVSYGSDVNQLPGIVGDSINRVKLLGGKSVTVTDDEEGKGRLKSLIEQGGLEALNINLNIDLSLFGDQLDKIDSIVDDITKGMCNGFSFGGSNNCKGLPVPFNQAFLAPGKYHLFGCWELPMGPLEGGIPMFFFPGTLPTPVGPIPIPWGLKQDVSDDFLWPGGGSFPSLIRIYAAPTLTAQLGIAICMSPERIRSKIPSPISDIAGNCVVFAIKPQCKKGTESAKKKDKENPNEVYENFVDEVKDSGICLQSQKGPQVTENNKLSSPFVLYKYNSTYKKSHGLNLLLGNDSPDKNEWLTLIINTDEKYIGKVSFSKLQYYSGGINKRIDIPFIIKDFVSGYSDEVKQGYTKLSSSDAGTKKLSHFIRFSKYGYYRIYVKDEGGYDAYVQFKVSSENSQISNNNTQTNNTQANSHTYGNDVSDSLDVFDENTRTLDVNGGSTEQIDFSLDALGIINLEMDSYIGPDVDGNSKNSIFIGDVDVLGGEFNVNKIKGGIQQGLRKILIDKWLDPQIRYILNQLTKMHINIKFPDVSNLVSQEVQSMKNVSENAGDIWKFDMDGNSKDETGLASKLGFWSYINSDNLQNFNRAIANPFESLASLLNESNIINVSVEPVTVKVPMIFAEDINAYEIYLQQRLSVNTEIVNHWKAILSDAEFDAKFGGWIKLQDQIYTNLVTLQKYRNFPFEIYEWIHVIDRYLSEIASLINNTIGYLSYWTSTNSQRFVGYVDAIVLIINIIKTYQLLINFSVEWGQNCGSCSSDTYDQYSCKLSILCDMIQLPIIQIPNFKLPNITIDLTDIDLGLDIILPDFNFQPVKIALPEIPNLPEPPSIGVDIQVNLPDIPLIPEPPELPELPSFIPEIELELPILPPAPELPALPGEIEVSINLAKLIGKIYCIVKGKFGLVGESSVKAKIEQLTQRTYEVKWIDTIMDFTNLSVAPVHNYGLDYEVSTHVDLQFDFSVFYDYLDTLTKSINNLSTSAVNWVNKETNTLINNNAVVRSLESVDGVGLDVNLELGMNDSMLNADLQGLESDDIEYVDYNTARSRLKEVLAYFKQETKDTTMGATVKSSVTSIENQINKVNKVVSNDEGLETLRTDVLNYLDKEKNYYDDLANMINDDYDGFLAMVETQNKDRNSKFGLNSGQFLAFNVQLFNVDSSTKDVINNIMKSNPFETILDNKKDIIDGYWTAINSNTAADLGLSDSQYLVLRNSISSIKNQVVNLYSLTKPISSTELVTRGSNSTVAKSLLSASSASRLGSNSEVASVIDPSLLSKGIYATIITGADKGKLTKIVHSDSFVSNIGGQYYHLGDQVNDDIVLWDEGAVYLKCFGGSCSEGGGGGSYYVSKTVKEIPYEETWLEFKNTNMKLKIADGDQEVKNRKVIGQTYDTLSFAWDIDDVDAYLIKLDERIDHSYEKADYSISTPVHYVLALPNGIVDLDYLISNGTKLELLKKVSKIQNLLSGGDLVQVVYYDSQKSTASITLSNIDRKWYYAHIATLSLNDGVYNINSPWSNQIVAGKQVLGDEQAPDGVPSLYRPSMQRVVSQGDDLDGYVGTNYNLVVNRSDNVSLSYIALLKDGNILDEKYTSEREDSVSTNIDIHTKAEHEAFTSIGIDQFGNRTEKSITVTYSVPDIEITDILKNSDGETVSIKAELSQDIDQGNVSFQRRRGTARKTMKRKDSEYADFSLAPGQTTIVGSPYSVGNEIAIYDKNGKVMALMNPDTAEIKLQTGYKNSYEVRAIVQNSSVLQIFDKVAQHSIFSISIPAEECLKIEANNYSVVNLPGNGKMGMFNGGKAVYKDGNNVLFASPSCHLYSEIGLEGTYDFDRELDAVVLTLYQSSDLSESDPIKVWVKVKPFIKE